MGRRVEIALLRRDVQDARERAAATVDAELQRRKGELLLAINGTHREIHALNNAYYDIERFGCASSPRRDTQTCCCHRTGHQDMRQALERTYDATPAPKWVVAVGDCAIDGGCFAGSYAVIGGVAEVIPVDLHVQGCPPHPLNILKGLLALLQSTTAQRVG